MTRTKKTKTIVIMKAKKTILGETQQCSILSRIGTSPKKNEVLVKKVYLHTGTDNFIVPSNVIKFETRTKVQRPPGATRGFIED